MDLAQLRERVNDATGPDRYVDFWATVLLWEPEPADDFAAIAADIELVGIEEMWVAMPFSSSLDAALALVERVLPGWRRTLLEHAPGRWEGVLGRNYSGRADKGPHEVRAGVGPTPALALLAALLQAKATTEDPSRSLEEK